MHAFAIGMQAGSSAMEARLGQLSTSVDAITAQLGSLSEQVAAAHKWQSEQTQHRGEADAARPMEVEPPSGCR